MLRHWCWVSKPEYLCLSGWPFCLLSSCFVDGSPVSRDEKWCCCLSPSLSSSHQLLHLHPSPTHPFSVHTTALSSDFYSSFSPFPSSSLHLCLLACLSISSFPPLPPVLSIPAKRLAGVFSTVVTFKTECHHCLSRSLSTLIPPFHLSLPLPPPPPPHSSPIPPSSSCSEGLLDQVLCLEVRLALT